jgi:outer membrane protein OmpA-like peptidoglycan-associated protein
LAELKEARFHPGIGRVALPGIEPGEPNAEAVHPDKELPPLTTEQWNELRPVGELSLAPIEFGRGSANLTLDGERELQALARRLQSFPRYYLRVLGHARTEGDPEANRLLAKTRAEAAAQYLAGQGLTANRVKAEIAPQASGSAGAQAVSFVVGQVPY